ncbi:hypothetical protein [Brachyspira aalborgi]|uniref:Uncharacterized protein n=2 Tax=Brachyspira aalborgi TaxID=29522 RepID=A0A5C8EMT0_9SPIR|nr:hypothetical protein [Brachyspira aalborgi]TXJ39056.1 hypothetical protein EPJ81_08055 [Brachyspira aalborgi]
MKEGVKERILEIINRTDLKDKEKIALIKFFILEDENELYYWRKKMKVKKEYLENDKNIIDFLEENQNREDFEIIDLNTNKKVSVQECVDIMIKNSSIYNDSEEDK